MKLKNIFLKKANLTEDQKAERFWKWFDKHQNKFLFLSDITESEKDKLMDEFLKELHKFNEDIYFEIGGHPEDEKVELVISAEGIVEHFPAVEKLTSFAPEYKNWDIIAFKPPMGTGFSLNYRGKKFDPEKIIYIPLTSKQDPKAIGFNVCYPDFEESEKEIFVNGTYLILDTIIGEKSCALDIDHMEVIRTPENIVDYDFGHLSNIAEYITERKNVC
ncbi:hypothetical protein [Pseudozobellia sp. WGM2]|uniref:hypothetical protein n=1 Tax=Pseudozobellia sp. WGM2 TaxID=2787625 RepID=UPI001AE0A4DB|nr:hypothetical protein [Pseudozobellia sp. WGM2]